MRRRRKVRWARGTRRRARGWRCSWKRGRGSRGGGRWRRAEDSFVGSKLGNIDHAVSAWQHECDVLAVWRPDRTAVDRKGTATGRDLLCGAASHSSGCGGVRTRRRAYPNLEWREPHLVLCRIRPVVHDHVANVHVRVHPERQPRISRGLGLAKAAKVVIHAVACGCGRALHGAHCRLKASKLIERSDWWGRRGCDRRPGGWRWARRWRLR